jgi:hypothetical protein
MKPTRTSLQLSLLSGCLFALAANGQTMIESFEYANDSALLAKWSPSTATVSLSSNVAPTATGIKSMRVDRSFSASAWDAELITGPLLSSPLSIASTQYIAVRITGDPQFKKALWQQIYVYAYDGSGNFGRWGASVPTTTNWHVLNFAASSAEKPWDSPALPDLNNIVRLSFNIFGQGEIPGAAFSATVYLDELMVRNSPLIEVTPTSGPQTIEDFEEYASDTDLLASWSPMTSTLGLSSYVAAKSKGTNSMRIDRYFSSAWDTEVIKGPLLLDTPMSIAPTQYVTFRIAGDPQFTNASWQMLYLYVFDGANNFGRWGGAIPTSTNWQIVNVRANTIEKPWNSTALPDLNNIVQCQFYVYGQGETPGAPYSSTIYVDDVMVRDTPLIEFPAPSAMRIVIDDFEGYADDTALMGFYQYVNSPVTTVTTASLQTPAPQGNKALKLGIDFAPGQYPWGSVYSAVVAPFSFPTNAGVSLQFKGDPTLAPVADDGTVFYLSFYDQAGNAVHFTTAGAPVTSSNWTILKASYNQFWSTAVVDTGNLVKWRLLVEGWTGTSSSPALSGTFYVDNIKITLPPVLSVVKSGTALSLKMDSLLPGTNYTLLETTNFAQWSTSTVHATSSSQSMPITVDKRRSYRLYYTP